MTPNFSSSRNHSLSRREREIMDVIYSQGKCTVSDVVEKLRDPPSYDSVRVTLGILAKRRLLKKSRDGKKHVFSATRKRNTIQKRAIDHLTQTFFSDSPSHAILALIDRSAKRLSDEELDAIEEMLKKARSAKEEDT